MADDVATAEQVGVGRHRLAGGEPLHPAKARPEHQLAPALVVVDGVEVVDQLDRDRRLGEVVLGRLQRGTICVSRADIDPKIETLILVTMPGSIFAGRPAVLSVACNASDACSRTRSVLSSLRTRSPSGCLIDDCSERKTSSCARFRAMRRESTVASSLSIKGTSGSSG